MQHSNCMQKAIMSVSHSWSIGFKKSRLSDIGTIQGSILGPFLYAIYVAPLQDLHEITLFADDNFPLASNTDLINLISEFEIKLDIHGSMTHLNLSK